MGRAFQEEGSTGAKVRRCERAGSSLEHLGVQDAGVSVRIVESEGENETVREVHQLRIV